VLICCLWGVIALATGAEKDVSQDLASTEDPLLPQRLYETNNCPIATKPTCDDPSCQGIFDMVMGCAFAKYTCSNQSPVHLSESARPVILAHCRCCPRLLDVSCAHSNCAAAVNTYICQAYPLRGCACQTYETLEGEEEVATNDDPLTAVLRLHLQPNDPPSISGDRIMEVLRNSNRLRRLGTINDSIFESTRQVGLETPQQSTENASDSQEIINRDVPSSHTNESNSNATHTNGSNSNATYTNLGFYPPPRPTYSPGLSNG
jgi:hypothetical protein